MLQKLRKFLALPAYGGSQQVVTGNRRPLGYQQMTMSNSVAAKPSLTAAQIVATAIGGTINFAVMDNEDATIAIRWRDDGTAPTTTTGNRLPAGAQFQYAGDLTAIQFISESGTPKLNVSLYA